MAIVGGTASELGGGKFANGAWSSAFGYMYNDLTLSQSLKGLYNMKGKILDDAKQALISGTEGAIKAIDKSPWYAKLPLLHASGIVGAGGYSGGVLTTGYVLSNPINTTQYVRGLMSGNPTVTTSTSIAEVSGFVTRQIIKEIVK
ncbi:MAG: hypothetical protein DSZ06_02475 [Sulfurospirillum sp.]|nr:MAG: hypothetical protein DSZ06_02475 [Sulfurospirillum sp.]